MPNRCLNKVVLIGNLTRDPELRYTPGGMAVCTFGIATNRTWTTKQGDKKDDAQFHRVVAWNKLAELCAKLLTKGMRVYVEGRLQYRDWTGQDGQKRQTSEVIIEDMILLDNKGRTGVDVNHAEEELEVASVGNKGGEMVDDIVIPDDFMADEKAPEVSDEPASDTSKDEMPF